MNHRKNNAPRSALAFRQFSLLFALCLMSMLMCGCWDKPNTPPANPSMGIESSQSKTPSGSVLTQEQKVQLAQQCNTAIAFLENLKFDEAIKVCEQALQIDPRNLQLLQNGSVASVMRLEELVAAGDPKTQSAAQTAQTFLTRWKEAEPTSAALDFLNAKVSVAMNADWTIVAAQFDAALAKEFQASYAYEKYLALRRDQNAQAVEIADQALLKAHEIDPHNVQISLDLLQRTTEPNPLVLSDELRNTLLESLYAEIGFLAEGIESRTRQNPVQLIEQLQSLDPQADKSQWLRNSRVLINIVRPESVVQSDKAQVAKNLLEYISLRLPVELQHVSHGTETGKLQMSWTPGPSTTFETSDQPITATATGDFDLDGFNEVVIARGGLLQFYRHDSAGKAWELWTTLELNDSIQQILCLDLDNDFTENNILNPEPQSSIPPPCRTATIDMVLRSENGVTLAWNRGLGSEGVVQWEYKPLAEMLGADSDLSQLQHVTAFDFDADGDIDLVGANATELLFWQQQSRQQFADVSSRSALSLPQTVHYELKAVDLDHDIDLDLVIGIRHHSNQMHCEFVWCENLRHGEFRLRELSLNSVPVSNSARLIAVEDYNNDGHWDLLVNVPEANTTAMVHEISLRSASPGQLTVHQSEPIVEANGTPMLSADFDNNGSCDLITMKDSQLQLLRRNYGQQGKWLADESSVVASIDAEFFQLLRLNEEGDSNLDLLVVSETGLQPVSNTSTLPYGQLSLTLLAQQVKSGGATASGRVNSYGYGSTVEVRSGSFYTRTVVDSPVMHLGLGRHDKADSVRVVWTNGIPGHAIDVARGTYLCEKQELKGSCPYLYAWNGTEMTFVTDLLWGAPIGLIGPSGDLIPAKPREELVIHSSQLQPFNGRYRLSITEELWEFAYFDQVELLVVDHPAQTVLATNEKIGPPSVSMSEWHLMSDRRPLRLAVSGDGRDLTEQLSRTDDWFARPFTSRLMQGLTEPSVLELHFDPFTPGQRVRLVMTGWNYPTDTSINVQLSQSKDNPKPEPPSLWVQENDKQWQVCDPMLGFPGGKTKTVVYEITPHLNPDDPHIQIRTSMELYWDEAYLVIGDPSVPYQTQRSTLLTATLRPRGYSRLVTHRNDGPDLPDYGNVESGQKWPSLSGMLTRYGNVTELLETTDDRLLVMGPGDEVQLQFEEPLQPIPEGWIREFVIVNTGWDKDADLNTVYGTTAEPLPFLRMSGYPLSADDAALQQTERFDEYLKTWQTRPSR